MSSMVKNAIKPDDRIYRFYGFLGSFAYRRKTSEQPSPRDCTDEKGYPVPADNILFIYGVPQGGKTVYKDLLIDCLKEQIEYIPLQVNFRFLRSLDSMALQTKLRDCFTAGDSRMKFPFLDLLVNTNTTDLTQLNAIFDGYMSGISDMLSGNPIHVAKGVAGLVQSTLDTFRLFNADRYCRIFQTELKALREEKRQQPEKELFDERDVFKFLRNDLSLNAHHRRGKRYICFVDNYELGRAQFTEQERKELLQMMNSVSDMLWVLFSAENPGREELRVIPRENQWRINGLSRRQALSYLQAALPDEKPQWYERVYRRTGGNPGLMDLCINAQRQEEKKFIFRTPRELMLHDSSMTRAEAIEKSKEESDSLWDAWFEQVWDDHWDCELDMEQSRENPIAFLMQAAFESAENGAGGQVQRNLVPCLCYLAEKSKTNLGTIHQYCWQRDSMNITELNDAGHSCLREIEVCTPLCIEYVEYPGMLYLDPVIVRILTRHIHYARWLEQFRRECVVSVRADVSNRDDTLKSVHQHTNDVSGSLDISAEDIAKLKKLKMLELLFDAGALDLKRPSEHKAAPADDLFDEFAQTPGDVDHNRSVLPHRLRSEHTAKELPARQSKQTADIDSHGFGDLFIKPTGPKPTDPLK